MVPRIVMVLTVAGLLPLTNCTPYSDRYKLAPPNPSLEYRPVGVKPPPRSVRLLTPSEQAREQASVEAAGRRR